MNAERAKLYYDLEKVIGNTPLTKYQGNVPNENQIYIKEEHTNLFGSHYDRVYLELFRHYEEIGKIKPGDKVVETSSGSAGVSFAGIGKILRYECYCLLPAGGEKARENAILEQLQNKDHLIFTDEKRYTAGLSTSLKKFLVSKRKIGQNVFPMNHSTGEKDPITGITQNNEIALFGIEGIGREIKKQLKTIDYFIPAGGNGTSILGPSRALDQQTKIITFETIQAGVFYEKKNPGKYEELFGIKPGSMPRHNLPGTIFPYSGFDFPHINNSLNLIEQVILISNKKMDADYFQMTGKTTTEQLPHEDDSNILQNGFGKSTRAGIATALEISKNVTGKNIVIIGYDKINRYDAK
jgi:cysteine synthase